MGCVSHESHSQVLKDHDTSQRIIQKCAPQERNPWAPKFEERTQDEALKQERCGRKDAWELAKNVHKLIKESKDTFYSVVEAWVMLASSSKNQKRGDISAHSL